MKTNDTSSTQTRPHVVIVGGGFAGQALASELKKTAVDITLIDKNNFLTFQPLLYQVATAGLEPEEIVYPIRAVFQNQNNFRFRLGKVVGVDWRQKKVYLEGQLPIAYDYLVIAAGTTPNFFGISGAQRHCFPLKQLSDAINLRSHVLKQFEKADRAPELLKKGLLNFAVIGGGPTGVEMAGALIELFQNTLTNDYPELPVEKARVILIEAGGQLLGAFNKDSQKHAHEVLSERGVHIVTNERVIEVADGAILLGSKRVIKTATPIWAVGVKASPLAGVLQLEQTRGGRILVNGDLSIPEKEGAFVIGDMAGCMDEEGNLHPQLASVAKQGAKHVAAQIKATLDNKPGNDFRYKDPGIMATIGRHAAVAEFPGEIRLEGFFAWLTWLSLHLLLLVGFHNRVHVLVSWLCNYFTKDRSARLILDSEDEVHNEGKRTPRIPSLPVVSMPVGIKDDLITMQALPEKNRGHSEALDRIQHILQNAEKSLEAAKQPAG
ncbi:MAG: NAD(P)/FAD-dependent oxidoreductase [Rhodothermales bacterium]